MSCIANNTKCKWLVNGVCKHDNPEVTQITAGGNGWIIKFICGSYQEEKICEDLGEVWINTKLNFEGVDYFINHVDVNKDGTLMINCINSFARKMHNCIFVSDRHVINMYELDEMIRKFGLKIVEDE